MIIHLDASMLVLVAAIVIYLALGTGLGFVEVDQSKPTVYRMQGAVPGTSKRDV